MAPGLIKELTAALVQFSSSTRLYELKVGDKQAGSELLVEAFFADDALDEPGWRDIIVLSTTAHIALETLLGQQASLEICLADGTRTRFAGDISEVAMLGSDGGFARYRVRISPWIWRLGQVRNSRVWQDKSVMQIVDAVFAPYRPLARWRWSTDTGSFIERAGNRSYCCQYRESDLDFVRRLLAEEGLCWRFEQTEEGPGMVLFSDSSLLTAVPEDPSSKLGGGIRYHGAHAVESQDTVQGMIEQRRLHASLATVLSPDYKSKLVIAASSPTRIEHSRKLAPIESYDVAGQCAYTGWAQAARYADLQMEGWEARGQLWYGRSTVRTLQAGTRLAMTGMPRQAREKPTFTVLRVLSIGVNNLPPPARHALAELFRPIPELLQESLPRHHPAGLETAAAQAIESGYANCFDAVPTRFPWRPQLPDSNGRTNAKPTAHGSQTAIVIGADGIDIPNGPNELYCDRLGRVRIRFHWQESGDASCWVRVAQRSAGGGMGSQFLPRIGQEVLVQFLEGDIDRPIIIGALYNGRGEGGIVPTPGGRRDASSNTSVFKHAHDHAPSAQGNLAGGNSPVWHGASSDSAGHQNGAAQWGIRSKEFGASGYNQLLFDDTDARGRIQLKCTHAATELNLGHLIHAADNYRGSFRGLGAELRTDAYGAVRAGGGLLISSYSVAHSAERRDAAGENGAGTAMLKQVTQLVHSLNAAALTHQTVGLAAHLGAHEANASTLDDKAAPLAAMLRALSGAVNPDSLAGAQSDVAARNTEGSGNKLPHLVDPLIVISAKDGFGAAVGQSLQLANGETVSLVSGQDTQFVSGGQMRVHSGQAIGVLGGAVKAGEGGVGLQMIAAKDAIDIQAQSDELKIQAREDINVISANAHIDWAAAKRISLSTAGGANITIEDGNITVQCPGKITVHAGKKSFIEPASLNYPLPKLPRSELEKRPLQFKMRLADTPGSNGHALANTPWKIAYGEMPDGLGLIDDKKLVAQGLTDDKGNVVLSSAEEEALAAAYAMHPDRTWLVYPGHVVRVDVRTESPDWDAKETLLHALDAADFSPDLHTSVFGDGAMPQTRYAKEALEVASSGIFPRIKT
ncbi:type VI secretion system tip protein VgrG [Massilia sp. IC2-278]|uniref:type VI secretion system Vgr family protein n=1 Tax=Massilia sp. IC2-278 TaxID=2887200 RepID=UPI001E30AE1A|nr:type VI secretion system Vgr family protein [Massilia sp. IC2-278]MCC2963521.1 type VI secretion system tip protein VgrG [Massilia sp. IC2-278]